MPALNFKSQFVSKIESGEENKMEHQVIVLKKHSGEVEVAGEEIIMKLPEGCTGILFCFESKKAARKWWGKDTDLIRFEYDKD